jgi:hypothetical protein
LAARVEKITNQYKKSKGKEKKGRKFFLDFIKNTWPANTAVLGEEDLMKPPRGQLSLTGDNKYSHEGENIYSVPFIMYCACIMCIMVYVLCMCYVFCIIDECIIL